MTFAESSGHFSWCILYPINYFLLDILLNIFFWISLNNSYPYSNQSLTGYSNPCCSYLCSNRFHLLDIDLRATRNGIPANVVFVGICFCATPCSSKSLVLDIHLKANSTGILTTFSCWMVISWMFILILNNFLCWMFVQENRAAWKQISINKYWLERSTSQVALFCYSCFSYVKELLRFPSITLWSITTMMVIHGLVLNGNIGLLSWRVHWVD